MDKIGDAQFRVMCDMWGVDDAIEAAKRMGMEPTEKQIKMGRERQKAIKDSWANAFKGTKHESG